MIAATNRVCQSSVQTFLNLVFLTCDMPDPYRQFTWLQIEILSALRQLEERLSPAELKFLEQQLSSSLEDTGKQFVRVSNTLGEDTSIM
jgi:hypothetical protein